MGRSHQPIDLLRSRKSAGKFNAGRIDRLLGVATGLILTGLAATGTVGLWAWTGIVPLATGLVGGCPAGALPGWNTGPVEKQKLTLLPSVRLNVGAAPG